jgi:hypothetical protein
MDAVDFPFAEAAEWLNNGEMVPFLGAGASIAGVTQEPQLPGGSALARELVAKMPSYPGDADDDLATVAQFYEDWHLDRKGLYGYMHKRFFTDQAGAELACVPRFLATVESSPERPLVIMSTNYDTHVERAFAEAGRDLCVITQYVSDPLLGATHVRLRLPGKEPTKVPAHQVLLEPPDLVSGTPVLYKMHGSADHAPGAGRDPLVLTEDDYIDFLMNAGGSGQSHLPPVALTQVLGTRRFLFLGYSLRDWNFRVFLGFLTARNLVEIGSDLRHWAVQDHPLRVDEVLWRIRHVSVVSADLVDFIGGLKAHMPAGAA